MAFWTWQLAQSPLNTACRSPFANCWFRSRSAPAIGVAGAGRIVDLTESILKPLSVLMVSVLKIVPDLPARFMVTGMAPFVPGGTLQGMGGNFATVQPQDVPT